MKYWLVDAATQELVSAVTYDESSLDNAIERMYLWRLDRNKPVVIVTEDGRVLRPAPGGYVLTA